MPVNLTRDGLVNQDDVNEFVLNVLNTRFGDIDLDGDIDATDLNQVGVNWRRTDVTGWSHGDFNGDGRVDSLDLNEVTANWRHTVIVPAPASLATDGQIPKPSNREKWNSPPRANSTHDAVDELFARLDVKKRRSSPLCGKLGCLEKPRL